MWNWGYKPCKPTVVKVYPLSSLEIHLLSNFGEKTRCPKKFFPWTSGSPSVSKTWEKRACLAIATGMWIAFQFVFLGVPRNITGCFFQWKKSCWSEWFLGLLPFIDTSIWRVYQCTPKKHGFLLSITSLFPAPKGPFLIGFRWWLVTMKRNYFLR